MTATPPISRRRLLAALAVSVLGSISAPGQEESAADPAAAEPLSLHAFYIGHSLMSDLPSLTRALVEGDGRSSFTFRHQDIPGAPLRWQWGEKDRESDFEPTYGGRYHIHLPQGGHDLLILTDSVPRGGEEQEAETADYLGRFVEFARREQPEIRVLYYETWHHLSSGTPQNSEYDTASPRRNLSWRERLDGDREMWERIVRQVNENHPGGRPVAVEIIPAGQVLAAVHDAIEAGEVPGLSAIGDLFSDEIHLNLYGKYVVALAHAAVITGRSPVGMPSDGLKNVWGGNYWNEPMWYGTTYAPMPAERVLALQRIVERVLRAEEP